MEVEMTQRLQESESSLELEKQRLLKVKKKNTKLSIRFISNLIIFAILNGKGIVPGQNRGA